MVISFDIFLFVKHATSLLTSILIGVTGTIYMLFLIYLVWKPLQVNQPLNSTQDGWMSLPQHEDDSEQTSDQEVYAL